MATENSFSKLNAADLSTIILKGSPNPSERDAGFCSGSSEVGDDTSSIDNPSSSHNHNLHQRRHHDLDQPNSPTDTSEDSVEVKITPISYTRNKRKSTEPSRVIFGREETGPLKKRIRYHAEEEFHHTDDIQNLNKIIYNNNSNSNNNNNNNNNNNINNNISDLIDDHDNLHFRPWNESECLPHDQMPNPAEILIRHPGVTTLHRNLKQNKISNDVQDEPLALIAKKSTSLSLSSTVTSTSTPKTITKTTSITSPILKNPSHKITNQSPSVLATKLQNNKSQQSQFVKTSKHKQFKTDLNANKTNEVQNRQRSSKNSNKNNNKISYNNSSNNSNGDNNNISDLSNNNLKIELESNDLITVKFENSNNTNSLHESDEQQEEEQQEQQHQRPTQRNYKNMTRERRIEANARERTRVHTISAAYDTLRKSVPAYSNSQKLSKLSVLRVACSYILTLSRMAGYDYSEDQSSPSLASCVDMVTKTIQTEGKIRKKKDE